MLVESILSNEIFQNVLQVIIILSVLRAFFISGIIFTIIAVKMVQFRKPLLPNEVKNRISPNNTFEVIFFNFFGIKLKPFLLNKV
jgi:hypothetical protein